MLPESGCVKPEIILISVDFPAPFSPIKAWPVPEKTLRLTLFNARTPG